MIGTHIQSPVRNILLHILVPRVYSISLCLKLSTQREDFTVPKIEAALAFRQPFSIYEAPSLQNGIPQVSLPYNVSYELTI